MRRQAGDPALESASEVVLQALERSVEQGGARNDDNVHTARDWRSHPPENLSNQSFSAVSRHRVAKLPRGDDAQASTGGPIGRHDECKKATVHPYARLECPLVFAAAPHAAGLPEALGGHVADPSEQPTRQRGV